MHPTHATACARLVRVKAFCNRWTLDLTVGCQHGCLYCPFQRYQALLVRREQRGCTVSRRLSLRRFLRRRSYPSELLLSGHTDPCAPAARHSLEQVLRRVLPLGVRVEIITKGVVSARVMQLLAASAGQVNLSVGVASLDERRNTAVEPGCPSALARLSNLRLARSHGLSHTTVRLDPLLPGVDDDPAHLSPLLDEIARLGARSVVASYLFITLRTDRARLAALPILGPASAACTEASRVDGWQVLSVPLRRKLQLYSWLQRECAARRLRFATCGCKDLRLRAAGLETVCTRPAPAAGAGESCGA